MDCFCLVVPSRREPGLSPPVGSCLPHGLISHVSHCWQTLSLIRLSVINLFFNSNEWINIHLGNVIKSHRLILSRIFCFYRENNKSIRDQTAVRLKQPIFIIYQAIIQIEIIRCKHFCEKKKYPRIKKYKTLGRLLLSLLTGINLIFLLAFEDY